MTRSRAARSPGRYPLGTVAYYGPDNTRATKLVASVFERPGQRDPFAARSWTKPSVDVRHDAMTEALLDAFFREEGVKDVVTQGIVGCPHDEGVDYPMGRTCPLCPFWIGIDRVTHEPLQPSAPALSPEDVLAALSVEPSEHPLEALESADAHREALVDPLLRAIDACLADPLDAPEPDANLFSYALYLFAKWREPRAYLHVVRWLSLPGEAPFDLGGDIVTQDGGRILASVCDGNLDPIKQLILDTRANEYGRSAGVTALALLAAWAEVPHEVIVNCFEWLATEGLERQPSAAWDTLAWESADIEAMSVFPALRQALEEGLIDPQTVTASELDEAETARPESQLAATRARHPPIDDVAEATAWWGCFHEDDEDREAPYIAPPKVGRNEPCPCGSGKKYKKCHGV